MLIVSFSFADKSQMLVGLSGFSVQCERSIMFAAEKTTVQVIAVIVYLFFVGVF